MKYLKKYSNQSSYDTDTKENNQVSIVASNTIYYSNNPFQIGDNKIGNIIVEDDGLYQIKDGNIFPVSHPDLSTQPSLLPERLGQMALYEVLIPKSEFTLDGTDPMFYINIPDKCEQIISAIAYGNNNYTIPLVTASVNGNVVYLNVSNNNIDTRNQIEYIYLKYAGPLPQNYYSGDSKQNISYIKFIANPNTYTYQFELGQEPPDWALEDVIGTVSYTIDGLGAYSNQNITVTEAGSTIDASVYPHLRFNFYRDSSGTFVVSNKSNQAPITQLEIILYLPAGGHRIIHYNQDISEFLVEKGYRGSNISYSTRPSLTTSMPETSTSGPFTINGIRYFIGTSSSTFLYNINTGELQYIQPGELDPAGRQDSTDLLFVTDFIDTSTTTYSFLIEGKGADFSQWKQLYDNYQYEEANNILKTKFIIHYFISFD